VKKIKKKKEKLKKKLKVVIFYHAGIVMGTS
jgi:hypothetical protein